jgi:hypothetical protein
MNPHTNFRFIIQALLKIPKSIKLVLGYVLELETHTHA